MKEGSEGNREGDQAMKCVLCDRKKAKRFCPAKQSTICAPCCGAKRILEIDCPESCGYLKIGRDHEASQEGARHYHPVDINQQEKWSRLFADFEPVIVGLQTTVADERLAARQLTDADVAEALDCLLKTLRTEEHGVFYETSSENLRADALRRQMSLLIESFRQPQEGSEKRLQLGDAIDCLELLRTVVGSHLEAGSSGLSFVDFVVRYLPRSSRMTAPGSSIIIPGR